MESMAEGMIKDLVASGHALADDMTGAPSVLVRCLAAQLEVQLVRANALAAENAGLKKSEVEFNEYCRHECEDVGDTWVDDFTETPATDAFLDEVRASGVDAAIEHLHKKFGGTGHIGVSVMALEWLAQEIRKGGAA
ncbi:hypothetical protein DS167_25860 [Salmonella enterica subsp. enterica serovar Newport]|nr:hypothetical protein [Salmonella enterica subsp. enterica serovar Newport]